MPRKKLYHVRDTIGYSKEDQAKIEALAAEWKVTKQEVLHLMITRGLTIEAARQQGYKTQMQSSKGGNPIDFPDDRPNAHQRLKDSLGLGK